MALQNNSYVYFDCDVSRWLMLTNMDISAEDRLSYAKTQSSDCYGSYVFCYCTIPTLLIIGFQWRNFQRQSALLHWWGFRYLQRNDRSGGRSPKSRQQQGSLLKCLLSSWGMVPMRLLSGESLLLCMIFVAFCVVDCRVQYSTEYASCQRALRCDWTLSACTPSRCSRAKAVTGRSGNYHREVW